MPSYSSASTAILGQLHPDLQRWLRSLILITDHKLIEGPRDPDLQRRYFETGLSKGPPGPLAPHTLRPCQAVHLLPYPWRLPSLDGQEARERFHLFAGVALEHARAMGIGVRWGGDWNQNLDPRDNGFDDLLHYELRG